MIAQAILFDLDGTLWHSRAWYEHVLVTHHGASRELVVERLAKDCPPALLAFQLAIERSRLIRSCEESIAQLVLYPGIMDTLEELAHRGTRMAAVTSEARDLAEMMLRGHRLRAYFETLVTPSRSIRAKPHPDSLNHALCEMGIAPARHIYYVGDKNTDATAAAAAGLSFAWVEYGYGCERPESAGQVIQKFSDVLSL